MAVSNELIMNKMMAELQQAKATMNEPNEWKLHISSIKLLSELLLDGEKSMPTTLHPHDKIGDPPVQKVNMAYTEVDDASIFDF